MRVWPADWPKPTPDVAYHVTSGNHRTSAAQIKKLGSLRARIIEAPDELSYMIAAIRTNARHGRNFSEDERKINAAKLKSLGQSADQIAKLFGVNRATVYNWISGRDSNAGKKEKREAAMRMLAAAEAESVDEDWSMVPDVPVSDKQMMQARIQIHNFLSETPVDVEKSHVIAWVRSLSLEMRQSHAADMRESLRWLQNVVALLTGGDK